MQIVDISSEISRISKIFRLAASRKHMVIMVGGPASGKGFFSGEGGAKLPESTQGLVSADDIPPFGGVTEESDASLRLIQAMAAKDHYHQLQDAKAAGNCDEALEDLWYMTKDGNRKNLSDILNCDEIPPDDDPEGFDKFYRKNKRVNGFYVSMRGWHDDAKRTHTEGPYKGKQVERFKDKAREQFDQQVKRMMAAESAPGFLVLDSAGEDIDVQDFEGQIKNAQANGYEVSVVYLDIDPRDTKLSNKFRGAKGDRMVDESDIDNFFEKAPPSVEKIKAAAPDRFLHYQRTGGALTDQERKDVEKTIEKYNERRLAGAGKDELKGIQKDILGSLYRPQYQIQPQSSIMRSSTVLEGASDREKGEIKGVAKDVEDERKAEEKKKQEAEAKKKQEEEKAKGEEKPKGEEYAKTYKEYKAIKSEKGEKPLSQEQWERRVFPEKFKHEKAKPKPKPAARPPAKAASIDDRLRDLVVRIAKAADQDALEKVVAEMIDEINRKFMKIRGYRAKYEQDGYDFYVTLMGAAADGMNDISALKEARKNIQPIMDHHIKKFDSSFKSKVRASRKGSDIVIHCSVEA